MKAGIFFLVVTFVLASEALDSREKRQRTFSEKVTTCNCGWLNRRDFEIIEGDRMGRNKYPMVAAIRNHERNQGICSGVIVTTQHVLTVSKCVSPFEDSTHKIGVYVGQSRYQPEELCLLHDVEEVMIKDDFGLLKLKTRMRFNRLVGPMCSPLKDFAFTYQIRKTSHTDLESKLVGWEMYGPEYRRTHHVPLTVQTCPQNNQEYCTETFQNYVPQPGNTCNKQPGSPILWYDNDVFRYIAVGLIDGPANDCNRLKVYPIRNVVEWIKKKIESDDSDSSDDRKKFKLCYKMDASYGDFADVKKEE